MTTTSNSNAPKKCMPSSEGHSLRKELSADNGLSLDLTNLTVERFLSTYFQYQGTDNKSLEFQWVVAYI